MGFPFANPGRSNPISSMMENLHSVLSGQRDPISDLTRDLPWQGEGNNFADAIHDAYGPQAAMRNFWRQSPVNDGFSIVDSSTDLRGAANSLMSNDLRSSRELMSTLSKHFGGINIGRHNSHITKEEIGNYLVRAGDTISPRDRADLAMVAAKFETVKNADGRDNKGISFNDMAHFVVSNRQYDHFIMAHRENLRLQQENRALRDQLAQGSEKTDKPINSEQGRADGNVLTHRNGPKNHYLSEGTNMELSQEAFKKHYGISEDIDLLKFMPGKANDGKVPNFWSSAVSAGLGGRSDEGGLRWDDANNLSEVDKNFHRNLAQLADVYNKLPPQQQEEFFHNFARTQKPLMEAHGIKLLSVDNEKVQIHENGSTRYVDFIFSVGSPEKQLQWG